MRLTVAASLALLLLAASGSPDECAPVECMRRLNTIIPIERFVPAPSDLPGIWESQQTGLSGRVLYLFEDKTYITTEWADVIPNTITDRGRWRFAEGLLSFDADSRVTWSKDPERICLMDRRFLSIRPESQQDKWWLVGLDDSMLQIDWTTAYPWRVEFYAFVQTRIWGPGEGADAKKTLLKEAWRPDHLKRR